MNGADAAKYLRRARHAVPLRRQRRRDKIKSGTIVLPIAPLYFLPGFSIQSLEWVPRIYLPELSPRDGTEFYIRQPIPLRSSIEAGTDEVKEKNLGAIVVLKMFAASDPR